MLDIQRPETKIWQLLEIKSVIFVFLFGGHYRLMSNLLG